MLSRRWAEVVRLNKDQEQKGAFHTQNKGRGSESGREGLPLTGVWPQKVLTLTTVTGKPFNNQARCCT